MSEEELLNVKSRAARMVEVTIKLVNHSFEMPGRSKRNISRLELAKEVLAKLEGRRERSDESV
jgi:hypothetical protein